MSNGGKWTPGKIFLLIVGILAGLGILCCGGIWFVAGDKIMSGIHFGTDSAAFVQRLQKDFGPTAHFSIDKNDKMELILTIGVEGDLTPERVVEVQDTAWKAVGDTFGQHGFMPVKFLAVGHPVAGGGGQSGGVRDWAGNTVSIEELVARTGVPAPPNVKFLPDDMGNGNVKFKVGSKSAETPVNDEEGGGAEPDGK